MEKPPSITGTLEQRAFGRTGETVSVIGLIQPPVVGQDEPEVHDPTSRHGGQNLVHLGHLVIGERPVRGFCVGLDLLGG